LEPNLLLERWTVMSFCVLYVVAASQAYLAAWLMSASIVNWNKGRRNRLLIKLARSYIEGQRPSAHKPA